MGQGIPNTSAKLSRPFYRGKQVKRITELGVEKLCPCCDDWWPQTSEFFTFVATIGHYRSECRACLASAQAKRRANKKEAA